MKKFRVMIEGKNLLMSDNGHQKKCGFFTTRWIEAKDSKEAEARAIELIWNDKALINNILNEKSDSPIFQVVQICELENFIGVSPPGGGYSLFPE